MRLSLLIILISLTLGTSACGQPTLQPEIPTPQQAPTRTVTLSPPTPTVEPPTAIVVPTPTVTPLPTDVTSAMINLQSAGNVTRLKTLGLGMVNGAPLFSADGELLLIPTTTGVDFYEAAALQKIGSIPSISDDGETLRPANPRLVALSPDRSLLAANLYAFVFNPDGEFQEDSMHQVIYVWKVSDGTLAWKIPIGLEDYLGDLAFSLDGSLLAAGFEAGKVQLWSAADGEEGYSVNGTQVEFSPDGSKMVTMPSSTGDDHHVYLYNTAEGNLLKQWEGQRAVFSPDGFLAVESENAVRLIDVEEGAALKAFNGKSAAFSADGESLALLDRNHVRLYNLTDGRLLQTMEGDFETIFNLQFAPNGQTLAIVGEAAMCPGCFTIPKAAIWRVSDGTELEIAIHDPLWLTYAPNEGNLVIWAADSIQFLNPQDAAPVAVFDEYATIVDGIAFSPDGQILAANSGQPHLTARLWQVATGQVVTLIEDPGNPGYDSSKTAINPDGQILWIQGSFWRIEDGTRFTRLENGLAEEAPPYFSSSVAFSPDGNTMAVGYLEGYLRLWDLGEVKLIKALEGYQGEVVDLSFSQDGKTLAAVYGYPEYTIQLWKMPEGERSLTIKSTEAYHVFSQVIFSPDGQTLLSVARNEDRMDMGVVEVWGASDGQRLFQLEANGVLSAAISKDGEVIATGSYDHTVRLWQASDGAALKTLHGHGDYITDLAFSPTGELLASSSNDGTVILWGSDIAP